MSLLRLSGSFAAAGTGMFVLVALTYGIGPCGTGSTSGDMLFFVSLLLFTGSVCVLLAALTVHVVRAFRQRA